MCCALFSSSIEFRPDSVYFFSESLTFEGSRGCLMALNQLVKSTEMLDNCGEIRATKDVLTRLQHDRTAHFLCRINRPLAIGTNELHSTETELVLRQRLTTKWVGHDLETTHPITSFLMAHLYFPYRLRTVGNYRCEPRPQCYKLDTRTSDIHRDLFYPYLIVHRTNTLTLAGECNPSISLFRRNTATRPPTKNISRKPTPYSRH